MRGRSGAGRHVGCAARGSRSGRARIRWRAEAEPAPTDLGRFGPYGGRYVPETLMAALDELARVYEAATADRAFQAVLEVLLKEEGGMPTPLRDVPRHQSC